MVEPLGSLIYHKITTVKYPVKYWITCKLITLFSDVTMTEKVVDQYAAGVYGVYGGTRTTTVMII